jgi:D-alanyl-D-alanine carboxypeptidase
MFTKSAIQTQTLRSRRTETLVLAVAAVLAGTGAIAATADAAAGQSGASTSGRSAGHNRVMQDVAQRVLTAGSPGYVARIDDGHRVSFTVSGVADTATKRRLTSHDQFEIGSNTKTFTSVLALQQVDRGRLNLDAPVEKYLPGVVPNGKNITVRMLLNHTSGLFSYTGDPDFFTELAKDPQHVWTEKELLDVAFKHQPNFAPGTSWSYSNTNYTLIGLILQKQTGKSLADLVEQRIARPLHLTRTYYADPRATNTGPGYAHGYAVSFAGGTPTFADTSSWPLGGWGGAAGAVISTPTELSRFFSALLGGKLISQHQLKQMKTTVDLPADFPIKGGYGLGLFKIDSPCGTVWGHGGDTQGHHSTAVTTADGRRTAISDSTSDPSDSEMNDGLARYYEVAFAAQTVTICEMNDKPVPAAVTAALHGTTPTPSATPSAAH